MLLKGLFEPLKMLILYRYRDVPGALLEYLLLRELLMKWYVATKTGR